MPSRTSGWSSTLSTRILLLALILLMLLHCMPASALNAAIGVGGYAHAAWTRRAGTFSGAARAITQTTDGYLWIATESGIVRFNGVRFVPWATVTGSPLHAGTEATKLLGTRDGSLWIGTTTGLARWKSGALTTIPELEGHYVTSLREDRDSVLVGTSAGLAGNARVCIIRAAQVQCHGQDGTFGRFVLALHADRDHNVWVGSQAGLWRWSPGAPKRYRLPSGSSEIHALAESEDGALLLSLNREIGRLVDDRVERAALPLGGLTLKPTALLRDRDGTLWIGTQDRGLVHVSQGRVDRFSTRDGLSGDFVTDIFEDREGNVWVATLEGLNRFRDFTVTTLSTKQGLSASGVLSVLADPDGSVWIGTLNGLERWKDGTRAEYRTRLNPQREGVASLFRDADGRLWISSLHGLAYLEGDRVTRVPDVPAAYVHAMAEDRAKTVWVSEQDRGLFRLRHGRLVDRLPWSRLSGRVARALAQDPVRGGLWLGFFQGGIAYLEDGQTRAFFDASHNLGTGAVNSLFFDARHRLWIASEGGLSWVQHDRVTTLTRKNGLPCDAVHAVQEDALQSLWLSSSCGLIRITRPDLDAWERDPSRPIAPTRYDDRDGFLSSADAGSYGPKVTRAADGRLWFATYRGVSVVDPRRIPFNDVPPPTHIEQVIADGETHTPSASALTLPPLVRNLRIDYTALSLTVPERVRFRYMLEGRDTTWVEASDRREAFYTDLPPKPYRFRVIASNNDGVWNNEGATLSFAIQPAFHQTWQFRFLLIALTMGLLWMLYRFHLQRLASEMNLRFEARLAERARIAQELHDTLLQGFISTSMQLDVLTEDVAAGPIRPKLDRLLQRMREAIDEGRDAMQGLRATSSPDDLERALARDAEELRGHQAIELHLFVRGRPQPMHPLIRDEVYRIGREALVNAFRHAHATRIDVELDYTPQHFRLNVRDNGRGLESDVAVSGRPGHWGIPGMRDRADRLGATLKFWSRSKLGTEVDLIVPGKVAFQPGESSDEQQLFRRT